MQSRYFFRAIILFAQLLVFTNSYAYNLGKADDFAISYDQHGLLISRNDGEYAVNLFGYLEADFLKFTNDQNLLHSGTNIRYAMLYLNTTIKKDWHCFIGYALSMRQLLDAYITYTGFSNQIIQIGEFTPDVGFSNWTRHFDINFLEWPLPVYIFSPGYPQGINYLFYGKYLAGAVSVFSGSNLEYYATKTNPLGATGRVFLSPIHETTKVLHLGISNWWQRPNCSNTVFFGTTPEANSHDNEMLVATGPIEQVSYYDIISGEFVGVSGPWSVQTEYYLNNVQRRLGEDNLHFSGFYTTLGYFFTGESMNYVYPYGVFTGPTSYGGKYGVWQILARYSELNLNDKTIQGGKENNITLGLNWFVNPFVTFKFNVIRAAAHPAFNGNNVNAMIYATRAQIQF